MADTPALTSARLTLSELTAADAPFILELLNEPGWLENIGDRGVRDLETASDYIADACQASYLAHGFGLWKAALSDTGEPTGICGLLQRENLDAPDIGFAFLARHQGRGYAAEAARATLDWARSSGRDRVLAFTKPSNQASARLLEAIGFREQAPVLMPGHAEESRLFEWTAGGMLGS